MIADRLKEAASEAHARAERSGFVSRILRGEADLPGYALFLRNLCAVYANLEHALDTRQADPVIAEIRDTRLYRTGAARHDLKTLAGPEWATTLPILPSARRYADRIVAVADNASALLAHAYTRYLGDINGGQVVRRQLQERMGIGCDALRFFSYREIPDVSGFAKQYRRQFDHAGSKGVDEMRAIEETIQAFQLNIDLSVEVDLTTGRTGHGVQAR